MEFSVIVAVDSECGIGKAGTIPWNDPADRKYFREMTTKVKDEHKQDDGSPSKQNVVIMGRRTWESLPKRPLPNRINIVVSAKLESGTTAMCEGVTIIKSFEAALQHCEKIKSMISIIWVIGGAAIYSEAVKHPLCKYLHVTRIQGIYNCDVFFPYEDVKESFAFLRNDKLSDGTPRVRVLHDTYAGNTEEKTYLEVVRTLMEKSPRPNRTSSTTLSTFGEGFKFSLDGGRIPLLTSRRIGFKTLAHELLWFLSGATTTEYLTKNNVHIWDGNTTREFLDRRGLTNYAVGEVGAAYGWNWRHFGATYLPECEREQGYQFGGVDQIANVIRSIKKDPWGRRHIVTAWNPTQVDQTPLPPCHLYFQFYVSREGTTTDNKCSQDVCSTNPYLAEENLGDTSTESRVEEITDVTDESSINTSTKKVRFEDSSDIKKHEKGEGVYNSTPGAPSGIAPSHLSIMVVMRSGDIFHGIPFNIASYALLTHMIAKICGLKAKELSLVVGDLHLYTEHLEAAKELVERPTREFPTIEFSEKINQKAESGDLSISDFDINDFVLNGYYPGALIKVPMVV